MSVLPAGYSGTPLAKKLGMKSGFKVLLINAPEYYPDLFTDMPADVVFTEDIVEKLDLIHFFTKSEEEYLERLPMLQKNIKSNGMIWVSWPKKASKVKTDLREDIIRNYALQTGLVDVKVCAVDERWSGLKLVIRLKDRGGM